MGVLPLFKETGRQWSDHKILQLSAALAYYSIFSMAPLLVIAVAVSGWIFGRDAVNGQLVEQLRSTMGTTAAEAVQSMVQSAYQPGKGMWATITGIAALLLGASGVFGQLKDALNTIWNAPVTAGFSVWSFIRDRVISFSMVLVVGFLMLTSLLLTTCVAAAWELVARYFPLSKVLLTVVGILVSMGLTSTLFALIFKWIPDVPVRWRHAWIGGAATAALFEIGKTCLGIYLGRQGAASSYGAAGALVLVLLWIYYTSVILLTGATFTRAVYLQETTAS